ncbi:MAG: hypothetical protein ucyna2_00956 [Candidatus Atelocyanobacterium thalassa isolate SIO64986]|uniref:Uncharacterized protein n=1 Tax=Candidatus Atelocyanobacterium thalassa isolate SIO64986 TaxID=1527444 RepID=A0A086CGB2_9CHRO|nr:MAG: hypothetical protein ucyna2_00956 [Candidatus Atelocyanobacterium thalassa isolate SIO64986]
MIIHLFRIYALILIKLYIKKYIYIEILDQVYVFTIFIYKIIATLIKKLDKLNFVIDIKLNRGT